MRWIRSTRDVLTIAAVAVVIGWLPLPAEYYLLLRFLLCGLCFYFLTSIPGVGDREKWVLTGLVILYNPIFPIEPGGRLLSTAINGAAVGWLWFLEWRSNRF